MEKRPINEMLEATMQKIREMIDANTIIGETITTADGISLIPVSKVCLGLAGGGADTPKKQDAGNTFGGGIGAGVRIEPVAFIVVKDGNVKLMSVSSMVGSTLDKVIDTVPGVIERISELLGKDKEEEY